MGVKWVNEDTAFNGFLAIFNHKHDTLPDWIKQVQPLFHDNEKLFLRFLAVTGLRKNEALTSFNMIIDCIGKANLANTTMKISPLWSISSMADYSLGEQRTLSYQ